MAAELFIVATPIGNLQDFSPRGAQTLRDCSLILAEDTRSARRLMEASGVSAKGKRVVSYFDGVEAARADALVATMLEEGIQAALVSDAGTPGIADPGYVIVKKAREAGLRVTPIPGPSAPLALASSAGLPVARLLFVGFLPEKAGELTREIESWAASKASVLALVPTRRLAKALGAIAAVFPEARVAVGRELTKIHEEIVVQPVQHAVDWASDHQAMKGEATIMIDLGEAAGKSANADAERVSVRTKMAQALRAGATMRDILQQFRGASFSRKELYQMALELTRESGGKA